MKRVVLSMVLILPVLMGCVTAKLHSDDLIKVNNGELVRVETENQETMIDFVVGGQRSDAVGKMHDLRIRVKAVDGENVYRKFGDASQIFALSPGLHSFDYECTHNITNENITKSYSRLGSIEINLEKGYWYQLRSRATREVCKYKVIKNHL